ncbi:MAG: hypothetical protein FWB90_02810, partial [Fibromonadales bacterium]|nr:hypothetical protein [Fibromonadales bacterium]
MSESKPISQFSHYRGGFNQAVEDNAMFPLAIGETSNAKIGAREISIYVNQLVLAALSGKADLEDLERLEENLEQEITRSTQKDAEHDRAIAELESEVQRLDDVNEEQQNQITTLQTQNWLVISDTPIANAADAQNAWVYNTNAQPREAVGVLDNSNYPNTATLWKFGISKGVETWIACGAGQFPDSVVDISQPDGENTAKLLIKYYNGTTQTITIDRIARDGNGNVIANTYATKTELNGKQNSSISLVEGSGAIDEASAQTNQPITGLLQKLWNALKFLYTLCNNQTQGGLGRFLGYYAGPGNMPYPGWSSEANVASSLAGQSAFADTYAKKTELPAPYASNPAALGT